MNTHQGGNSQSPARLEVPAFDPAWTEPIPTAVKAMMDAGMGSVEKPLRFVYFSGQGVVQEGGTFMFQRVKVWTLTLCLLISCWSTRQGEAERDLLELAKSSSGRLKAQMLRPTFFFPVNTKRDTIALSVISRSNHRTHFVRLPFETTLSSCSQRSILIGSGPMDFSYSFRQLSVKCTLSFQILWGR